MSRSPLNPFSEKAIAFLKKVKELLSKDYSMQDLKNLKNLKSLPKTIGQKLSAVQQGLDKSAGGTGDTSIKFDVKQLPTLIQQFVMQHRNTFALFLVGLFILLLNAFVIAPFGQRIQNQLDMRPAQWSQLQSLIKLAKASNHQATGQTAPSVSYGGVAATVTLLDDMEMQKIRNVLTARGLKPNVFRLTADNPPRIEFQSSDVMFSVLLDSIDELRTTWRLYPEQLNVISSGAPGVVNISGVLMQYGGQAGVAR